MGILFQGVQWVAPTDLGISQLYLNKSKLENIKNGSIQTVWICVSLFPSMILAIAG